MAPTASSTVSHAAVPTEMAMFHSHDHSMASMSMSFHFSTSTPIFVDTFRPSSTTEYAAMCIFLVLLALFFRYLLALRTVLEGTFWKPTKPHRGHFNILDEEKLGHHGLAANNKPAAAAAATQRAPWLLVGEKKGPWRWYVDGPRAALDAIVVGVAYLLMLAVMTMNVGYFVSVIAGTFVGSLMIGRFAAMSESGC